MASIFAATLYARFAVFDILHLALGARPSEGALFGSLLLLGAAGCAPLLTWKCSTWREGRRIASFLGISGLLLIFLQPPLPFKVMPNHIHNQKYRASIVAEAAN